jgi:hypothetical protein
MLGHNHNHIVAPFFLLHSKRSSYFLYEWWDIKLVSLTHRWKYCPYMDRTVIIYLSFLAITIVVTSVLLHSKRISYFFSGWWDGKQLSLHTLLKRLFIHRVYHSCNIVMLGHKHLGSTSSITFKQIKLVFVGVVGY